MNLHQDQEMIFIESKLSSLVIYYPVSEAYENLVEKLTKDRLESAIKNASPIAQTSALEGFHSVVNQFAPKMLAFSYLGMYTRYQIECKFIINSLLLIPLFYQNPISSSTL